MKIVEVLFGSLKDYSYISSVRLRDMKNLKEVKMIELESVGSVIDPQEAIVYPLFENGDIDLDMGVELYEVDDEWFEALSEYDLNLLIDYGLYEILK